MTILHWMSVLIHKVPLTGWTITDKDRIPVRQDARLPAGLFVVIIMVLFLGYGWNRVEAAVPEKKVACGELWGYMAALCHDAVAEKETQRDVRSAAIVNNLPDNVAAIELEIDQEIDQEIENLPEIIDSLVPAIDYLCRAQSDGRITCARLSTLLGRLSTHDAIMAVADLNQLQELFSFSEAVAVQCEAGGPETAPAGSGSDSAESTSAASGSGSPESTSGASVWTTVPGSDSDFEADGSISASLAESIASSCASLAGEGSGGMAELGGGFGDLAGGTPVCALSIGEMSDDEIAEAALTKAEQMREQCDTTLLGSLMEGDDETGDPTYGDGDDGSGDNSDGNDGGDGKDTITDNGDGTETVCTKHGCYVRYKTTTTDNLDGTQTVCTEHGCHVRYKPQPAEPPDLELEPIPPDLELEPIYDFDDDLDFTSITDLGYSKKARKNKRKKRRKKRRSPNDCLDETCQSCVDFVEFHPKLVNDCSGGVGSNFELCKEFAQAQSCCSSPNTSSADPLVITPMPGGDEMICHNADLDPLALRCEAQCSVADGDCYAECVDRVVAVVEFTLMDHICSQAIDDRCFFAEVDLGIGGQLGGSDGTTPPMPYWNDSDANRRSIAETLQSIPRRAPLEIDRPLSRNMRSGGAGTNGQFGESVRATSGIHYRYDSNANSRARTETIQTTPRSAPLEVDRPVTQSIQSDDVGIDVENRLEQSWTSGVILR